MAVGQDKRAREARQPSQLNEHESRHECRGVPQSYLGVQEIDGTNGESPRLRVSREETSGLIVGISSKAGPHAWRTQRAENTPQPHAPHVIQPPQGPTSEAKHREGEEGGGTLSASTRRRMTGEWA